MDKKIIVECIFKSISKINEIQSNSFQLDQDINEFIYGPKAKLDSTALINFLLMLEEEIMLEYDNCPNLFSIIENNRLNEINVEHLATLIMSLK